MDCIFVRQSVNQYTNIYRNTKHMSYLLSLCYIRLFEFLIYVYAAGESMENGLRAVCRCVRAMEREMMVETAVIGPTHSRTH